MRVHLANDALVMSLALYVPDDRGSHMLGLAENPGHTSLSAIAVALSISGKPGTPAFWTQLISTYFLCRLLVGMLFTNAAARTTKRKLGAHGWEPRRRRVKYRWIT